MAFDPMTYLERMRGIGHSPAWQIVPRADDHAAYVAFVRANQAIGQQIVDALGPAAPAPAENGELHERLDQGPPSKSATGYPHLLKDHGGSIITSPRVVNLYIGPAMWFDVPTMDAATKTLVEDGALDVLSVYGTGRGTLLPSVPVASPVAWTRGVTITDAQIQAWLRGLLSGNQLPSPDGHTLYQLFIPDGVTVDMGGGSDSCTAWCGYHSALDAHTFYSVLTSDTCVGCTGGRAPVDAMTMIYFHELGEALTDAVPGLGYFVDDASDPLNGGETGDLCAWEDTDFLGAVTVHVQPLWVNGVGPAVGAYAPAQQPGNNGGGGSGGGSQGGDGPNGEPAPFNESLDFWRWIVANVPGLFAYIDTQATPANRTVIDSWLPWFRRNGYTAYTSLSVERRATLGAAFKQAFSALR